MPLIDEIRKKVEADQFEFSKHAVDQSIIRHISVQEIREIFVNAEVIEDYPEDKYGPSCLIFGRTWQGGRYISNAATRRGPLSRSSRSMNPIRPAGLTSKHGGHDERKRRETG